MVNCYKNKTGGMDGSPFPKENIKPIAKLYAQAYRAWSLSIFRCLCLVGFQSGYVQKFQVRIHLNQ